MSSFPNVITSFALLWGFAAVTNSAAAPDAHRPNRPQSLTIVLDCSDLMSDAPAESDEIEAARTTERFNEIKKSLLEALTQMAREQDHQVSLWLYGHRIAWGEGENPGLVEQEAYLNNYFSPDAAKGLEPGKDVELILPMAALDASQLREVAGRLRKIRPWGESPLYLAMTNALTRTRRPEEGRAGRLIVITAGKNVQWMIQTPHTKIDVLKAAIRAQVPVDIIALETDVKDRDRAEGELMEITERTGGQFVSIARGDNIAKRINETLGGRDARKPAIAQSTPRQGTDDLTPEMISNLIKIIKTNDRPDAGTVTNRITGVVTFFGKPVRNATVQIEGNDLPAVRTDELGGFSIGKVPAGDHVLAVEGIAKNKYRRARETVTVPAEARRPAHAKIDLRY